MPQCFSSSIARLISLWILGSINMNKKTIKYYIVTIKFVLDSSEPVKPDANVTVNEINVTTLATDSFTAAEQSIKAIRQLLPMLQIKDFSVFERF
jgi:hypothetical protein